MGGQLLRVIMRVIHDGATADIQTSTANCQMRINFQMTHCKRKACKIRLLLLHACKMTDFTILARGRNWSCTRARQKRARAQIPVRAMLELEKACKRACNGLQSVQERARACKSVQERARATFTSKTPVTRHISCAHATCAPQSSVLLISRGRVVVYGDVDDAAARVDPKSDAPALHVARRGAVQTEALLAVHARRPALVGRRAPRLVRVGSPVTGKFITRWFARSC